MRVVVLVACVVLSLGMLRSPQALAQAAGAPEARSLTRAELQRAKPKAPRIPRPAVATRPAPAPIPQMSYSFDRLGNHLHAVRWELALVGAAFAVVGIKDWDWGNVSGFQTIEEGWFAKNTRHGGMDKIGHSFSTYVIADLLTDRIRANADNPTGAPITGALVAFGIMGLAETLDGFTGRHRFSREDIIANGVGALFSVVRNSVPGLREKLDWRIMYTPASFER